MTLKSLALISTLSLLLATQALADVGFRKLDPVDAPPLVGADLEGNPLTLKAYKGKVVLVNFWATWCPPCRREMPSLQRLREKMSMRPFVILGIDSAEQRDEVEDFLQTVKVDFTIVLDPDSVATKQWKVFALPTSFLIGRDGKVRYSLSGPTEWDEGEAIRLIESLLQEH